MATHELKTWPEPFRALLSLRKTYEVRLNDRDFQAGDTLVLKEWEPDTGRYTGWVLQCSVTYISHGGTWGLPDDICVMALGGLVETGGGHGNP